MPLRYPRPFHRALALLAAAALSGCAAIGGSAPAPDIYDLTAPAASAEGGRGRTTAQLLVPTPSAVAALATERIVVRPVPAQIAYYPGATWSDELPDLVQTKLVRAFENSGRAKAVGRPGESLSIDYQVIVDIRAFELDVAGGRTARVELGVKLLDDRTGRVRATRLFTAAVPAGSDAPDAAVRALDAAAGQVFGEIVAWVATAL